MAANTTLRSGTSRDTAVFSTGVIPIDGDKVTVSKTGTVSSRTLSAGISASATSIPVSAGTGTLLVGETIEFDARPGEYYEVTGPGAIGATALSTGAASITVSPGVSGAIASGAILRNRGHKVVLLCANRLTDTAGYAIGATSINLQAGGLAVLTGNMIRFGSDATCYKVAAGVGTGAGAVTLAAPGLTAAIPASATSAIELTVWGDDTTTGVTVNGTLYWDRAASAGLVAKGNYVVSALGTEDRGQIVDQMTTVNATLLLNYSATMAILKYGATYAAGSRCKHYGKVRTRKTTTTSALTAGATSFTVVDATGWAEGDSLLVLPTATGSANTILEQRTIAPSGVSGNTITITAGLANSKLSGAYVINLSSNILTGPQNNSFAHVGCTWNAGAAGLLYDKDIVNSQFTDPGVDNNYTFKYTGNASTAAGQPQQWRAQGSVFQSKSIANVSEGAGNFTSVSITRATLDNCVLYNNHPTNQANAERALGAVYTNSAIISLGGQATGAFSGTAAIPTPAKTVDIFNCLLYGYVQSAVLANVGGSYSGNVHMTGLSSSTLTGTHLCCPGSVISGVDFAPFGMTNSFGSLRVTEGSGKTVLSSCKYATGMAPVNFGAVGTAGIESRFGSYFGGASNVHEIWRNEGYAYADTSTRNRGDAALNVCNRTTSPFVYTFTSAIPNGATRRVLCNVRRNATYAAGSMPSVTLSIPGVTSVSSAATDVADTWVKTDLSITNTTGSAQEITVTLSANGAANASSSAWFDGVAIYPFVQVTRWYGFISDEANPFRTVDPVTVLSESAALALSGISVNHTTDTITVTAARTVSEVYDYCCADWVANIASTNGQMRHISSDGVSFTTSYTVVVSGGGSIAGKYTDASGSVVSATVSGIVPGSRVLIVRTDTNAVLSNEIVAGTSHSVSLTTAVDVPVSVVVRKASAPVYYQEWTTTGTITPAAGFAATANQQPD